MSFLFSRPEPQPLPPLPKAPEIDVEDRRRKALKAGMGSRIFTSPLGVTDRPKTSRTLLGD